jgi:hypothetical protein
MSADTSLLGNPYPDPSLSLPEALAELDRRDAVKKTRPQPMLASHRRPAPVLVARTDRETIERALAGARGIDFAALDAAKAVPGLTHATAREIAGALPPVPVIPDADKIFAAMDAQRTGPQAVVTREPAAPGTGWPEGIVRGMLVSRLWDAAYWYEGLDPESCADCEAHGGLCGFHAPRCVKAFEYEELHDFAASAPSDTAALSEVAVAIRAGSADLGDIASPGSPLEGLLLDQLEQIDAEGRR